MKFSTSPRRMIMAGVATIDSFRESIVGFRNVTNTRGYREERSNRGYQSTHFRETLEQVTTGLSKPHQWDIPLTTWSCEKIARWGINASWPPPALVTLCESLEAACPHAVFPEISDFFTASLQRWNQPHFHQTVAQNSRKLKA
jgi:hypothetical protein